MALWVWALKAVPWRTLLRHTPTIVEAARTYYTSARRQTEPSRGPERPIAGGVDGLRRALDRLEEREVEQAAIVADLAKQMAEMATAIEVLRARQLFALWGAAIATALGLAAVLMLLLGGR